MKTLCIFLLSAAALAAANVEVVFPPGAKPVGPYSPGILTGEYLYVSGQGARQPDGKYPPTFEGQVRQCLENIKTIVEAAHLTMEHVVYTQIYLTDVSKYELMNPVLSEYFTKNPPARATLGVYRMPIDTPVEISAVVVRDLSHKKAIIPPGYKIAGPFVPGVQVGDRVFISGFLGRDPATGKVPDDPAEQVQMALDRFHTVLAAAGLDWGNVVFINPYMTKEIPMEVMNRVYAKHFEFGNTPARATIPVHALPMGAHMEFTGIAVAGAANRKAVRPKNMAPSPTASPCVFAGDTYYCSAKSGFIPGVNGGIWASSVEDQVRQTMRNLLDGLEEAGLDFSNVVATNVYIDNIDDFSKMNGVYGKYFQKAPPTRTTVSPLPPVDRTPSTSGHYPKLEEISIIAVK